MSKTMKTKVAVVLSLVMILSFTLFVGCDKNSSEQIEETQQKSEEVAEETQETKQAEENAEEELDYVELSWHFIGGEQTDQETVFAAANEIIKSEINANVNFIRLGWGDYEEKMQLMTAAGEEYDLCFSAGWINNYKTNVEDGAFLILDDLIPQYAPKTYAAIPENIMEGTKVNGHLYGFPGYQVSFRQAALIFNKELVEKYDLADTIDNITSLDDLTPILYTVQENEPDYIMADLTMAYNMFYPYTADNYIHPVYDDYGIYIDYDYKVRGSLDDLALKLDSENYNRAVEWYKAGFFHSDVGMGLQSDFSEERSAGKFFVINDVNKPGVEADMLQRYGYEVYVKPMGMSTISTGSITSNMTVVSITSKNPERAVMVMELMNNNVDLYNTIVFGIEDTHYIKTSEDRVEVTNGDAYSGFAWMMGNQFNAYKLPAQADDVWEVTKKLNEEAIASPDLGFYFEDDEVRTELANVQAVYTEYADILYYGIVDNMDDMIAERNEKLEKAGLQKVIDEMQSQVDAWRTSITD